MTISDEEVRQAVYDLLIYSAAKNIDYQEYAEKFKKVTKIINSIEDKKAIEIIEDMETAVKQKLLGKLN